jgi:hypothetical protein
MVAGSLAVLTAATSVPATAATESRTFYWFAGRDTVGTEAIAVTEGGDTGAKFRSNASFADAGNRGTLDGTTFADARTYAWRTYSAHGRFHAPAGETVVDVRVERENTKAKVEVTVAGQKISRELDAPADLELYAATTEHVMLVVKRLHTFGWFDAPVPRTLRVLSLAGQLNVIDWRVDSAMTRGGGTLAGTTIETKRLAVDAGGVPNHWTVDAKTHELLMVEQDRPARVGRRSDFEPEESTAAQESPAKRRRVR